MDKQKISAIEMHVIDKVREMRKMKNISQAELAYMIDVTPSFIGHVESMRKGKVYNLDHINAIAEALNCSPRDLLPEKPMR